MALFYGRKKIAPIINKANTIRNQNKTVTAQVAQTTTVEADANYTGLGEVTVNVAPPTVEITTSVTNAPDVQDSTAFGIKTRNLTFHLNQTIQDDRGANYGQATANIQRYVTLEPVEYTLTVADISGDSDILRIEVPPNKIGTAQVSIDLSVIKQLLEDI